MDAANPTSHQTYGTALHQQACYYTKCSTGLVWHQWNGVCYRIKFSTSLFRPHHWSAILSSGCAHKRKTQITCMHGCLLVYYHTNCTCPSPVAIRISVWIHLEYALILPHSQLIKAGYFYAHYRFVHQIRPVTASSVFTSLKSLDRIITIRTNLSSSSKASSSIHSVNRP